MTRTEFNALKVGDVIYWGDQPNRVIAVCDDALLSWFDRANRAPEDWPPRRKRGRVVATIDTGPYDEYGSDVQWFCSARGVRTLTLESRGPGYFDWMDRGGKWIPDGDADA
jgi:hypothetical protein